MSDPADAEQRPAHLFKPGQSGNPAGRPKGARNKLAEDFLKDLSELWHSDGAAVLQDARKEKPMEFAKMVAGLLPRELLVRTAPEDDMTDDELSDTIDALETLASKLRGGGEGARPTHGGTGSAQ